MQLLNELVELAKKATPGDWCTDSRYSVLADAGLNANYYIAACSGPQHRINSEFIAAANPAAILAIAEQYRAVIARAEKAEERADDLENKLRDRVESYDTLDGELTRAQDRIEALENRIAAAGKMIIPAGWKIVPANPTPEMMVAGTLVSEWAEDPSGMYRAMIGAAPEAPHD